MNVSNSFVAKALLVLCTMSCAAKRNDVSSQLESKKNILSCDDIARGMIIAGGVLRMKASDLEDFDNLRGAGIHSLNYKSLGNGQYEGSLKWGEKDIVIKHIDLSRYTCEILPSLEYLYTPVPSISQDQFKSIRGCSVQAERYLLATFLVNFMTKDKFQSWDSKKGGDLETLTIDKSPSDKLVKGLISEENPSEFSQYFRFKGEKDWRRVTVNMDPNCRAAFDKGYGFVQ